MEENSNKFEMLLNAALKIPGIKVDREEFLTKTFVKKVSPEMVLAIVEKGPVEAGIDLDLINKIAKNIIKDRTLKSSGASFMAGLPGGLALAATIPADTIQFFGMALRLAQEIGYVYGYDDFWDEDGLNVERVNGDLIIFLAVMFGVGGGGALIRTLSSRVSQQILRKLPQKALTKTIYYPVIKRVAGLIGIKLTKDSFAKGISKTLPIAGGFISGGITLATMNKMGTRLVDSIHSSISETIDDFKDSFEELKREFPDIIDADFEEIIDDIDESKSEQGVK